MKLQKRKFVPALAGVVVLSAAFFGCDSETSTGTDDDDSVVPYSQGIDNPAINSATSTDSTVKTDPSNSPSNEDNKNNSGNSDSGKKESANKDEPSQNKDENKSVADWMPTSSAITETQSSEEVLAEAKKAVSGTCGPNNTIIEKGEMVTWTFNRNAGDVYEQIMAPFVWTFDDGKELKGNGMHTVNRSYENSGKYTATLNVDGNEIACAPLNVQGIPITITSCKADKASVTAGETITWTVEAQSEAEIVGYSWVSSTGNVVGSSTTATMLTTSDMHKKTVNAIVSVSNVDKTFQDYTCEGVGVVDPNQVDVVIAYSGKDKTKAFPAGETIVAQFPPEAHSCQMVCSTDANGVILEIDGTEYTIDFSANISPKACTDGSAADTKISVKASMQVSCYVTW